MKEWIKFLIIGWSIVSVGIIIVSFQMMKEDYIQEDYTIMMLLKTPERFGVSEEDPEGIFHWNAENLFLGERGIFDENSITKKEFVERMKKAKGVEITSKNYIVDKSIYIFLPIYAFGVWAIPIIVFTLIRVVFTQKDRQ